MSDSSDWAGLVTGHRSDVADHTIVTVFPDQIGAGGSSPILVQADDHRTYWIKTLDNRQGDRVPITEQIVARCGNLIGAPTCEVALLEISTDFDNFEIGNGRSLHAGIAHGSLDVSGALFERELTHREDDDNRKRHAYIYALYDWCWGGDDQWLFDTSNDHTIYSHDHGWYLPPNGPQWNIENLKRFVGEPHPCNSGTTDGITAELWNEVADRIESVKQSEIAGVLHKIPSSWPVNDADLEALGHFLEERKETVATRIRDILLKGT